MNLFQMAESAQVDLQFRLASPLLEDSIVEFLFLAQQFTVAIPLSGCVSRLPEQVFVTF